MKFLETKKGLAVLILIWIGAMVLTKVAKGDDFYPLALTPETLQSIRAYYEHPSALVVGAELSFVGEKAEILKSLIGDNLKWNHSFSIGILSKNLSETSFYSSGFLFLDVISSVGTGIKKIFHYSPEKSNTLKGEIIYFGYYYFDKTNIFMSNNSEFLSVYAGFKSNSETVASKKYLKSLFTAKAPIIGFYYNPNVNKTLSLGFETNLQTVFMLNFYFNVF